jgi:hypothetical protein
MCWPLVIGHELATEEHVRIYRHRTVNVVQRPCQEAFQGEADARRSCQRDMILDNEQWVYLVWSAKQRPAD